MDLFYHTQSLDSKSIGPARANRTFAESAQFHNSILMIVRCDVQTGQKVRWSMRVGRGGEEI
jgi:hypothetical protein